jgi:hypothetical protein
MMQGQPINPLAVQQAMQQAQQMMQDPNADPDGDGVPDPPEVKQKMAQQMLQQAAIQPFPFEDYQTHLETHGSYMKTNEFSKLPPPVQQTMVDHWNATLQTLMSIPHLPDPKAVQTTLQLKGTIGPTAAAEVLNKGGVLDVTPEQMAEQPLETWVTDSLDKPDVEEAGNDPFTQAEQAHSMALDQQKADMAGMKTAHQAALSHGAANRQAAADQQRMTHAEQLHAQKMRHAEQAAADKSRQARQPQQSSGR